MIPVADIDINSVGFDQRNLDGDDINSVGFDQRNSDGDGINPVGFDQRNDCIVTGLPYIDTNPNPPIALPVDTCQSWNNRNIHA